MKLVTELARLAADAEPPPLDEVSARRMVDRAIASSAQISAPSRSRARWLPAIAVGMAAAGALGWWLHPAPAPELLHVTLPTGDRLVGIDHAQFDVARVDPGDRRVTLHAGTLMANVAHVVPGQHFEITTAHLSAIAKGTVFSVETDAVRSRVRVYEGVVEVVQGRAHHVVPSGGMWASDTHELVASDRPPVLAVAITDAIAQRAPTALVARAAPPPAPTTPPAPAAPPVVAAAALSAPAAAAPPAVRDHSTEPSLEPAIEPSTEPSVDALLIEARGDLTNGKLDAALALASRVTARGATTGAWLLVTADALRGLGRADEAASTYQRAADQLAGGDAFEAGYSAAYLRFKELKDAAGALSTLEATRADSSDSPLEERGLALHVEILTSLGRAADARPIAQRYLERYPHGELRVAMQKLAK